MALLDTPISITYDTSTSGANSNSNVGITQSNDFDTWRLFTNALAENIEDLSIAVNEIDTNGAPLASPTFTGTPAGPTAGAGTNDTQLATTAFVQQEIGGTNLTELADVTITNALSGQVLVYNSGWKNVSVSGDITIDASGAATIANGAVEAGMLASNSVTSDKIGANAVTTSKILDGNVTFAKLATNAIVTEVDEIALNDNDTTLPTSAAVKDYVDSAVTAAGSFTSWTVSDGTASTTIENTDVVTFNNSGVDNALAFSLNTNTISATINLANLDFSANGTIPSEVLPNLTLTDFDQSIVITSSEGIASNNNNTTFPTSAAVKSYVDSAVSVGDITSVVAGSGLTGGGLSGDVTLNIGEGTGISVAADDISLKNSGTLSNNRVIKWTTASGQVANSIITDDGSTVTVAGALSTNGNTTLGDSSLDSITLNAATIKIANIASSTDDTVLIKDSGDNIKIREINPRVWETGVTLVDGTGTANALSKWSDSNTLVDSIISATSITATVAGNLSITGNTTLGNAISDYVTFNAAAINIPNVASGTDNTVLIKDSNNSVKTREIDSRVWGTSDLVDGSGTANTLPKWSDANTLANSSITDDGTNVTIGGNLIVNGTTTTINSTTLTVDDLNIVVANDATTSALADGAGLTINGAGATLTWNHATQLLVANKAFAAPYLRATNSSGNSGGYIELIKPATTSLSGNVNAGLYNQNQFAIFENGGDYQTAVIDITGFGTSTSPSRIIHSNVDSSASQVFKMVSLTEAAYNLLTPDANTLYIIV